MNLIETYALQCGLKISEPFIYQKYFPIPFEKFILVHAGGGMPSKLYDYYNEVIAILQPYLKNNDIQIIQVGGDEDPALHSIIDLRGKSSLHQTAYLLGRCSAFIGNDSCLAHIAASLNRPVVALYGSTSPQNHGPYFGPAEKKILIESHRHGDKPSFSPQEQSKTINLIKPETVASSVLSLLDIKYKTSRETLYIGKDYGRFLIDIVMNNILSKDVFMGASVNARMDLIHDEQILARNLFIRPMTITTSKPISINLLRQCKKHIPIVFYQITKNYDVNFVKDMMLNGIPYKLFSELPEDEVNKIKLDFFDYGVISLKEKISKEKIENNEKLTKYTVYKTYRFILAEEKIYKNEIDWANNNPISEIENNIGKINLEDPRFFEEANHYYIYNEKEQN